MYDKCKLIAMLKKKVIWDIETHTSAVLLKGR